MQGVHHAGLRNSRAIGEARPRAAGFFGDGPRSFQRSERRAAWRRWLVCGIAYGCIAYFMMTFVVVPLSNAGPGHVTFVLPVTPVLINGLAIHALGVGLPSAYFAARSGVRK